MQAADYGQRKRQVASEADNCLLPNQYEPSVFGHQIPEAGEQQAMEDFAHRPHVGSFGTQWRGRKDRQRLGAQLRLQRVKSCWLGKRRDRTLLGPRETAVGTHGQD